MNWMDEFEPSNSNLLTELDTSNVFCDDFKGVQQGSQRDSWWCVLVSDDDDCLSLRNAKAEQPKTIAKSADISFVGMQEVDGPILRLLSVVAERARYLEL